MHKFEYKNTELEYNKTDLISAAKRVFIGWVLEVGISEAIECACGSFWREGETNAGYTLIDEGDFLGYLIDNCGFLEHEKVVEYAENVAIARHNTRMEEGL